MKRSQEKVTNYFAPNVKISKPSSSPPDTSMENQNKVCLSTTHADSDKVNTVNSYPIIWSEGQWLERKDNHKWLICKVGLLGCSDCSSVNYLGSNKSQGLYLSKEWINCSVNFNGSDKTQELKSLRTKICGHQSSKAHKKANLILAELQKKSLETISFKPQESFFKTTENLFRTAYYIAKRDRPFTDYEDLINLQKANGLDLGITLHSRYSATEIIRHIEVEFKKKLTAKLITEEQKIAVIIDESTTLSQMSTLIVYIKTVLDDNEELIFLDLISLGNQKAETITSSILECLASYGLNELYLQKNLVCFVSDGASVMLGKKSGVGRLLQEKLKVPEIIIWHCLNHRLELSVHDSMADINAINHFKSFIDTIYALYSQSPKNWNELNTMTSSLGVQLTKINSVLDIRWVSTSFRSVTSIWSAYRALFHHFKDASNDSARTINERSKYKGL